MSLFKEWAFLLGYGLEVVFLEDISYRLGCNRR